MIRKFSNFKEACEAAQGSVAGLGARKVPNSQIQGAVEGVWIHFSIPATAINPSHCHQAEPPLVFWDAA
jgi:hypothetical protein